MSEGATNRRLTTEAPRDRLLRRAVAETVEFDTGRRRNPGLRNNITEQCAGNESRTLYGRYGKRAFDLVAATIALVLFCVPMLLIALAIRIDTRGPAMFRQERTGQYGRRFAMFKFRSMVDGAEGLKASLQQHNVHGKDSPDFKLLDDPRITRFGRFMRKTSIDELPNLLNVLTGDMSLVGPRPTSFDSSTYGYSHLPRLSAKPGVTGLWQVSGRANVDFDERASMDKEYIDNISFGRDLKLLVKTVIGGNHGAY